MLDLRRLASESSMWRPAGSANTLLRFPTIQASTSPNQLSHKYVAFYCVDMAQVRPGPGCDVASCARQQLRPLMSSARRYDAQPPCFFGLADQVRGDDGSPA